MYKVLIVDDERDLVDGLAMNFKREGYQVLKAYDGHTALRLALQPIGKTSCNFNGRASALRGRRFRHGVIC
jgi:response regulator RpfG family c-di-GMP phosphodiesterase